MEFNEKLQELRRRKGITQEELAESLYVSRTAVSKWESGRGYPSIESLKAIAGFYAVTIDELLSGDELLIIAQDDHRWKEGQLCSGVYGVIDCSAVLLLFLPIFGQRVEGVINTLSLLPPNGIRLHLMAAYCAIVFALIVSGVLTLALRRIVSAGVMQNQFRISLLLNALGVLMFIASLQPYAAAILFVFLAIKVALLLKKP